MLPLLFLPNPNDIERRESIDIRELSGLPTAPDMLTGGYFLLNFSCVASSLFRFPPNIELVRPKMLPIVLDLL